MENKMSEQLIKLKAYIKHQIDDIPTWEKQKLAEARIDELQSIDTLIDAMLEKGNDDAS